VLSEIGWTINLLEGGYKAYRRDVLDKIKSFSEELQLIIIAGRTGSGKTALLKTLQQRQQQILDLEDLASHRGSLLGQIPGQPQPGQRLFESRLVQKLLQFDSGKPVFVESESSRIGNLQIPAPLWLAITKAPLVTLEVPVSARADYLVSIYERLKSDSSDLLLLIDGMVRRHGYEITDYWRDLIKQQNWHALAKSLLKAHYDPAYDQSVNRHGREEWLRFSLKDCSEEQREITTYKIMSGLDKISYQQVLNPYKKEIELYK
jgi:tRNA 2-selenouridine synthase